MVEIVSTVLAILGVLAGLAYMAEQDAKKERARADAIRARERAEREADQQRLRDYEAKQNEIRRELRGR